MTELYIYIFGTAYNVELSEGLAITLQKKFKDFKDLTSSKVPKTLPISLPNTPHNRAIFSNYQEINLIDGGINHLSDIKAELYLNGISIIDGNLQIFGLSKDKSTINISIYDKTVAIFEIFKTETVDQVDFSDLDYIITDARVVNSWSGLLNAGKTIYPLADNGQGFGYQDPDNAGTVIDITGAYSIDPNLLSPAFQMSEIVTRILDDAVDRTDLEGWNFPLITDDMFWFNNLKPEEAQASLIDLVSVANYSNYNFAIPTGGTIDAPLNKQEDPANMITGGALKAIHTGDYKIDTYAYLNANLTNIIGLAIEVDFYVNGVDTLNGFTFGSNNTFNHTHTFSLTIGDELTMKLKNVSGEDKAVIFTTIVPTITAIGTAGGALPSGIITANNFFKEINKGDFFRDLVKMFNLVVYIDSDDILQFTDYSTWLDSGTLVDISSNILERNYNILSPYKVLNKTLKLGYSEGEDYASNLYERLKQVRYGSGEFISNVPFLTNTLDAEVTYQPYVAVQLQNNKRGAVDIPNLTGIKNVGSPQDVEASAWGAKYIMYWNGLNLNGSGVSYKIGTTSTIEAPMFSNYKYEAFIDLDIVTTDSDLNFFFTSPPTESKLQFSAGFDSVNSNTLWNRFYKPFIAELYNPEAKVLEVEAVFLPYEFNEIEDNSKLVIDGVLFRILELNYSVKTYTAKLTLLKLI